MTMNQPLLLLLLLLAPFFCSLSTAINCYAGSRGYVNGELIEKFHEEECDEDMKYCIESYNSDFVQVTASCQRLGTSRNILNICESGKEQVKNDVTIRCCIGKLCNNKGVLEKPKKMTP